MSVAVYIDEPKYLNAGESCVVIEFADEIDGWVIAEFQRVGCDSAKSVLELGKDELLRRTDLEEETIDHVLEVLSSEFE